MIKAVKRKHRVALGLSGGVDSAVAGSLLLAQGYDVTGVFIVCYQGPGCRTDEDRKDALDVSLALGIPFEVVDYIEVYREKVLSYFKAEYEAGRTPNPDVLCNREIKFGLFYEEMMKRQFDAVATGHYARIGNEARSPSAKLRTGTKPFGKAQDRHEARKILMRGVDEKKDQSYFLYQLREEQLEHILFPIGGMTKGEVRENARALGLTVAEKKDSVGICFVGEVSVPQFLKDNGVVEKPGKVFLQIPRSKIQDPNKTQGTNSNDQVLVQIGEHRGAWFYTIGQRHGFKIQDLRFTNNNQEQLFSSRFDRSDMPPLYVVSKDVKRNRLIVGTREECMQESFEVESVHFVNEDLRIKNQESRDIKVRIRHGGELIGARFMVHDSRFMIQLEEPVFGVAAGQSAVFYNDKVCLGGGVIV